MVVLMDVVRGYLVRAYQRDGWRVHSWYIVP